MKEVWFTSDWHLGHENMYVFTNYDGSKCRPWDNCEEAEEVILQNLNNVLKPDSTLYMLGDVGSKTQNISRFMDRLVPCRKILIMGNHDNKIGAKFLGKYFNEIRGCYNLENYIMTHIPVSAGSKGRFKANIAGHTHNNFITINNDGKIPDPWYVNVCLEVNDFKPVNFDDIKQKIEKYIQQGKIIIPKRGERVV